MKRGGDFYTNIISLILAFVLALTIWTIASEARDPVRTRFVDVPLEYVGVPANATLVDVNPRQTVQLRLEGPDSLLQEAEPTSFSATLDVSAVPPGEPTVVPIEVVGRASGITISYFTPEELEVRLEQEVTRDIPVNLDLRGSVARGHSQGEPLLEPASIRITGPASQVDVLNFALVTAFLNNTAETLVETIKPVFYDQSGRVAGVSGLTLSTDEVTLTVPVEELAGFADKLVTVQWTGEPAPGYRLLSVTAEPPSVLVEGRPAQINVLSSVRTEPIDITGLTESFQQTAVLDLPEGVSVDPDQTVNVLIEIEPILTTSTFNRVPILLGLDLAYEAVVTPSQVRVVLFGPLPILDSLGDEDVRVTLDLFGLESGVYSIEPKVDIPDRGIELRSVLPLVVNVRISEIATPTTLNGDGGDETEKNAPLLVTSPVPARYVSIAGIAPSICNLTGLNQTNSLQSICSATITPK